MSRTASTRARGLAWLAAPLAVVLAACAGTRARGDASPEPPRSDASPARDASSLADASTLADAGDACTFAFVDPTTGAGVRCSIDPTSSETCIDAARCICSARSTDEASTRACIGWETTPRGAITFADYCSASLPARFDMLATLQGYLGGGPSGPPVEISSSCASVPALLGDAPYDTCARLEATLCTCISARPCDVDRILGRPCLELTRAAASCIAQMLPADPDVCTMLDRLPSIVAACE